MKESTFRDDDGRIGPNFEITIPKSKVPNALFNPCEKEEFLDCNSKIMMAKFLFIE